MPSMLKGLCQGCGTRQVKQGIKVSFGPREKVRRFCAVSTFFFLPETSVLPIYFIFLSLFLIGG